MPTKYVKVLKNKEEKKVEEKEVEKFIKKVNTLLCSTDNYPLVKWAKYVSISAFYYILLLIPFV